MPAEKKRKHKRKLFIKAIRYYLPISPLGELDVAHGDAVSVDISEGGLGMITDYPLKEDDVVVFKNEIKVIDFIAISAVVKWSREIRKNKFRVGLELIK